MNDSKFYKLLIFINAALPLSILAYDGWRDNLGANPPEFFLQTTGVLTLLFLILTLAITPLRKIFGWNELIKHRRMLGLFAFFYGFLHLSAYSVFDKGAQFGEIVADIFRRPFITLGMLAFFLMIPLAVTSTNSMIKRLGGKNWAKLHRLTYLSAILGVVHYWMLIKSDLRYPIIFALLLVILLGYRIFKNKFAARQLGVESR